MPMCCRLGADVLLTDGAHGVFEYSPADDCGEYDGEHEPDYHVHEQSVPRLADDWLGIGTGLAPSLGFGFGSTYFIECR